MTDLRLSGGSSALSRRRFLGLAGATIAGAAWSTLGSPFGTSAALAADSQLATETVHADKLGVQMWTCLASWEADAPETLDLLAQMGYTYIEWAFMPPGLTPQALRKALDDTGLWCNGGHGTSAYPYNDTNWKQYVEDNLVIGARYLGANTGFPSTKSDCMKYVEAVYKAHDVARAMGHNGFQYNHLEAGAWNKLDDQPDTYAWEFIVENTSHEVWNVELDTLHALQPLGSMDLVLHYIRKHPGRMPFFHVKDGGFKSVYLPDGTAVGTGNNNPSEFGMGVFGSPDPADPENRPHAGFQDVFTAARETQDWNEVLLIAESDGSMATCYDYTKLAFDGLNGLKFPYIRPATPPTTDGAKTEAATTEAAKTEAAKPDAAQSDAPKTDATTTGSTTAGDAVKVSVLKTAFARNARGQRVARVTLSLASGGKVTARLTRNGKRLARTSRHLGKGTRRIDLTLPRSVSAGTARLDLTVTGPTGESLSLRERVRVPALKH